MSAKIMGSVSILLSYITCDHPAHTTNLQQRDALNITGIIGVTFFYRGMLFFNNQDSEKAKGRTDVVKAWLVLYGFVGSQMGWTLRPFFGDHGQSFQLFRKLESNFYFHIFEVITKSLGLG